MALLPGSLAIGAGAASSVAPDQRGLPLDSPKPDIGAFQYQGAQPTVTITGPTTATVQVAATFTLTATDPAPADQHGTFTYIIDWNGDRSDVQTIQGPASLQVTHAYLAAGSFTPIVTVLDQDNRSSSPAALAAPVVVTALSTSSFDSAIVNASVTLLASTTTQATTALDNINDAPASAWNSSNSATLLVQTGLVDAEIDPTSPSAQVDLAASKYQTLNLGQLFSVSNPYASGGSEGLTIAADVLGAIAVGFVAGAAFAPVGVLAGAAGAAGVTFGNWVVSSGLVALSLGAGVVSGLAVGATVGGAIAVLDSTQYADAGASPALIVDQGTVTASNGLFSTATDSPTLVVRGGTLILQDDFITGNFAGSQPLAEVDGGTLVLGASDGTDPNVFAAYGTAPFLGVAGTGMVIVQPGNFFYQITDDLTAQAAGATGTSLASSEPTASPGDTVTLTATVTAQGAPATDGSVEFFDDTTGTYLGAESVNNGSAAIQVSFSSFTAGDTIYATYLPTTGALAPSSGHVTQVVAAATMTLVTGPSTPLIFGQTATFTATVTNSSALGGTPIGTVEFFDGTTDLGPDSTLSGSGGTPTSTFSTANLTAGTHEIQAVFTSTSDFQTSTNAPTFTIQVVQLSVSSIASVTPNPRKTPVSTIDVTFDMPINTTGLATAAVTVTDNDKPVPESGLTFTLVADTTSTYQVGNLSTSTAAQGNYVLTVNAADIDDTYGGPGAGSLSASWLMDTTPPTTSSVNPLPVRGTSLTFPVSVTGSDGGSPPSGVASYTIYVSTNGGTWSLWTTVPASSPTATFTGLSNTTYAFYSTATDNAGNTQAYSPYIEVSTYMPDLIPPVTAVDGLTGANPSTLNTSTGTFTLNLTGSDPGGGVVTYLEVYVSVDSGPYTLVGPAIPAGPASSEGNVQATIPYQGLTDGTSTPTRSTASGSTARAIRRHQLPPICR